MEKGRYVFNIEQLVNIPLFENLYPQHLLVRPFVCYIRSPTIVYKTAKKIASDENLTVSPEIKAEVWTRYRLKIMHILASSLKRY